MKYLNKETVLKIASQELQFYDLAIDSIMNNKHNWKWLYGNLTGTEATNNAINLFQIHILDAARYIQDDTVSIVKYAYDAIVYKIRRASRVSSQLNYLENHFGFCYHLLNGLVTTKKIDFDAIEFDNKIVEEFKKNNPLLC